MRKFFFGIFLIGSFFLFLHRNLVFSQTPTPSLIPLMPGISCGNAEATDSASKCCSYAPISVQPKFPKPNVVGIDQLFDLINFFYNQLIEPRFAPLNNLAQQMVQPCINGTPSTPGDISNQSCVCVKPTVAPLTALSKLCDGLSAGEKNSCNDCLKGGGVWTGVGCIYATVQDFIQKTLLSWGIGLAGIIALLCIIYATFTLQTSAGNPEKIKKAQELLTSCIMGLMLIIFSVFILRLIGVDILRIPGFGR